MILIFTQSDREAAAASFSLLLDRHVSQTFISAFDWEAQHEYVDCIHTGHGTVVKKSTFLLRIRYGTVLFVYYVFYTFTVTERCVPTFTQVRKHRSGLTDSLTNMHTHWHTLCHTHSVALARIKLCYNNPIRDDLDSHSESNHIMMLWWVPVRLCVCTRENVSCFMCHRLYSVCFF